MAQPTFRYRVKIIDPSLYITRQLHHFSGKFASITALKVHLMENFGDHLPDTIHFNIGYFEGRQSKKRWLCCQEDVEAMYKSFGNKAEITLWWDAKSIPRDKEQTNARKRKQDSICTSKRQGKEDQVDTTFLDLKEKHGDKYGNPKLRLWARMITGGLHDSLDQPPAVPVFHGGGEPKRKKETLAGVLTGAVETIAKYVEKKTPEDSSAKASPSQTNEPISQMGISPGKSVELRMKNLEQLRYLQGLYEDKIKSLQSRRKLFSIHFESYHELTQHHSTGNSTCTCIYTFIQVDHI